MAAHFLIFIYLISCEEFNITSIPNYRCRIDTFEPIRVSLEKSKPINIQNSNSKRTLDNGDQDGFKDFNICLDLFNFEEEIIQYNLQDKRELYVKGMTNAINTLQSLLRIKPLKGNFVFKDEDIEEISINKWNSSLIGDKADKGMKELNIDLFIFCQIR